MARLRPGQGDAQANPDPNPNPNPHQEDDERMELEEPAEGAFYAGPSSSGQERGTGTLV